ncbi:MAG: T9SS type A sorting domain-containing protein [Chitinophagales bacterium]|nr:T9SS type A sorting domain-containing protein [Chitinophagales bacterium]
MQRIILSVLMMISVYPVFSQDDTLDIMYYNILNFPNDDPSRITELKNIVQYLTPDVLMVGELITSSGADDILNNALNENGISYYQKATFVDGLDTDNMLYFNSQKLKFYSQDTIDTQLRLINQYTLYANDPDLASHQDTVFIQFYVLHLKASQGSTNESKRLQESQRLMTYLNDNTTWENIIVGGDFNIYNSSEPAYQLLTNSTGNNLNDPINMPGNWHNNSSMAIVHTQSTRTTQVGSGSSGGMDDRFDQILVSDDVMNGLNNVNFIPGSYDAFGNDGLHFNNDITDPPAQPGIPSSIITDLYDMSDHIPVIAKLNIDYPDAGPVCEEPATHFNSKVTPSSVRLNWDAVSNADHYTIRGRAVGSSSYVYLNIPYTSPNYFNVNGLANQTDYEWEIQAHCDASETISSNWTGLIPFRTDCYRPDTIMTDNITATSARLNWLPSAGAVKYEIQGREVGAPNFVTLFINGGGKFKFIAGGLTPNTTYEWQIKSWCDYVGNRRSTYTNFDVFSTPTMKMELSLLSDDELRFYPNPADDIIHISLSNMVELQESDLVKIENTLGQQLIMSKIFDHDFTLDLSDLDQGMYRLVLPGNNSRWIMVK